MVLHALVHCDSWNSSDVGGQGLGEGGLEVSGGGRGMVRTARVMFPGTELLHYGELST